MMQAFVFFQINGLCTAYAYAMNADSFKHILYNTLYESTPYKHPLKAHTIQSSFMKVHTMQSYPIDAYSMNDDINYDDIQEVIDNIMKREDAINFGDYVNKLMSGRAFSLAAMGSKLIQSVNGEISALLPVSTPNIYLSNCSNIYESIHGIQISSGIETGYMLHICFV